MKIFNCAVAAIAMADVSLSFTLQSRRTPTSTFGLCQNSVETVATSTKCQSLLKNNWFRLSSSQGEDDFFSDYDEFVSKLDPNIFEEKTTESYSDDLRGGGRGGGRG
eukprot:3209471-Ditylum_brightwellii.AAC.1